jgi:hypothetical protein
MPVVVVFDFPAEDTARYHKVFELGGPAVNAQPDRLDHICYKTDKGFTVIDVWKDEASFIAFGSVIGPRPRGSRPDPPAGHPPARGHHGKRRQSRHLLTMPRSSPSSSGRRYPMPDDRYHRRLEAEVPGGSVAGWQVGAGPAVLLLHGGPGLSDCTFPLAAELEDAFGVIGYQ